MMSSTASRPRSLAGCLVAWLLAFGLGCDDSPRDGPYVLDGAVGGPTSADDSAAPLFRLGELDTGSGSGPRAVGPVVCHDDLRIGAQCLPVAQTCGDGRPGEPGARTRLASLTEGCVEIGPEWTPPCVGDRDPREAYCRYSVIGPPTEPADVPGADCAEPWRTAEGCRPRGLAAASQICPAGAHVATPRSGCVALDDVADPGEPGGCGDGPWGNVLPRPGDVFVDDSAAEGGDGSPERPLNSLHEAIRAVVPEGRVVLAEGAYTLGFQLGRSVSIRGRCASRVVVLADHSDPRMVAALRMGGSGRGRPSLTLSDLTLRASADGAGGRGAALWLVNAVADVRRVHFEGFSYALIADVGAATFEHVSITGARPMDGSAAAVLLGGDSVFEMRASEVVGGDTAVYVGRCSRAALEDVHVTGIMAADGRAGSLVIAREGEDEYPDDGRPPAPTCGADRPVGGSLTLTDVVVGAGSPGAGLRVQASGRAELRRVEFHGPGQLGPGEAFSGIEGDGASIDARQLVIGDAVGAAIGLAGTRLDLADSLIDRVRPVAGAPPDAEGDAAVSRPVSGFGILSWDEEPITASAERQRVVRTVIRDVHHLGVGVVGRSLEVRSSIIGDIHLGAIDGGWLGLPTPASAIVAIGPEVLVTDSVLLGSPGPAIQLVAGGATVSDNLIADGDPTARLPPGWSSALSLSADRLVLERNRITGNRGGGVVVSTLASWLGWTDGFDPYAEVIERLWPAGGDAADAPTAEVKRNRVERNHCTGGVDTVTLTVDSAFSADIEENTLQDNCAISAIQVFPLHQYDPAEACPPPASQTVAFRRNLVVGTTAPPLAPAGGVGIGCHLGAHCTFDGDMLLDNQTVGLQAWGRGTRLRADHVLVENTGYADRNYMGMGLLVQAGAEADVRDSLFTRNHGAGVAAMDGAHLTVSTSQIAFTGGGFYFLDFDPADEDRRPPEWCGAMDGGPGDPMLAPDGRCLTDEVLSDLRGPYVAARAADGVLAVGSVAAIDDVEVAFNERAGIVFDCSAGDIDRARAVGSRYCVAADDNVAGIDHDQWRLICEGNVIDDVVDNVPGQTISASQDGGPPPPAPPFRGED